MLEDTRSIFGPLQKEVVRLEAQAQAREQRWQRPQDRSCNGRGYRGNVRPDAARDYAHRAECGSGRKTPLRGRVENDSVAAQGDN